MPPPAKRTTEPAKTTKADQAKAADAERARGEQPPAGQGDPAELTPDQLAELEEQRRTEQAQQATEDASMGRTEARREADTKEERAAASRVCVVSDGTPHTGYALPGKRICSAHEIHYYPDGTPRRRVHAAAQKAAEKPGGGELVG